jgi:hypothetical protein
MNLTKNVETLYFSATGDPQESSHHIAMVCGQKFSVQHALECARKAVL